MQELQRVAWGGMFDGMQLARVAVVWFAEALRCGWRGAEGGMRLDDDESRGVYSLRYTQFEQFYSISSSSVTVHNFTLCALRRLSTVTPSHPRPPPWNSP